MSYLELKKEHRNILNKLCSKKLYGYILGNLKLSLSSVGFSEKFMDYFVDSFSSFEFEEFYDKFGGELQSVYDCNFFQKTVPEYFMKEVTPYISESNKILDLGCGTGILIYTLSQEEKFNELIGIDIATYPEWNQFNNSKVKFEVVKEDKFEDFLRDLHPDNIVITWTLHHMNYDEQLRYLKKIFDIVEKGTEIVILEDSYSEKLTPKNGEDIYDSFMEFTLDERKIIMSTYDWVANRILARRNATPLPFGYRTLEEWQKLCEGIGYRVSDKVFIGFPNKRDINTPQSLLILKK